MAANPYLSDEDLKAELAAAAVLGNSSSLPSQWDKIATTANGLAYKKIRAVLLGRGFTSDVIDAWEARVEWSKRFGLAYGFWQAERSDPDRGAAAKQEILDLIDELKNEVIVVGDDAQFPTTDHGRVGSGDMDTSDDMFTEGTADGDSVDGITSGTVL